MAVGDKKFFGPLEIKALKCQHFEGKTNSDTVAYIQIKDISERLTINTEQWATVFFRSCC